MLLCQCRHYVQLLTILVIPIPIARHNGEQHRLILERLDRIPAGVVKESKEGGGALLRCHYFVLFEEVCVASSEVNNAALLKEERMRTRNILIAVAAFAFTVLTVGPALADCAKINDGTILDTNGNVITLGYDQYGYNYQAHMFNGLYDNYSRPIPPATTGDVNLIMKWSDDWLSNLDCNGDNKLDRGLNAKTGVSTGVSMGWLTNHMEGDCETADGGSVHVTYFVKIVYDGGAACAAGSASCIWGVYAVIEEVGEDPTNGVCLGQRGLNRSSLVNPAGLGFYTN